MVRNTFFPENDYACTGRLYLPRAVANLLVRGPLIADFLFFNPQSGNEKCHLSSISLLKIQADLFL